MVAPLMPDRTALPFGAWMCRMTFLGPGRLSVGCLLWPHTIIKEHACKGDTAIVAWAV